MTTPVLEASKITKAYGGVHALSGIDLCLFGGEMHALVGENGAGKSTLIKILSGAVAEDSGTVRVGGEALSRGSVAAAEAAGIATIHQEATAFSHLTVAENIFVGRESRRSLGLLDHLRMNREAAELLTRLGLPTIRPQTRLGDLPLASRQMVSMARALSRKSRVLILDEPTASLSNREADALFTVLHQLKAEGVALLYVSHRLDEIFALCERATILRDGRLVESCPITDLDRPTLIRKMVGRDIDTANAPTTAASVDSAKPPVLQVQNLCRTGAFGPVSFTVGAGEIVGLGGLVGAGRSEIAQAIFGADKTNQGTVMVQGKPLPSGSIDAAIRQGIALIPEDRQTLGLVLPLSLHDNLALVVLRELASGGIVRSGRRERTLTAKLMTDLDVRAAHSDLRADFLSGGNQQKLVIGKWLAARPCVLILDEPTRGVDVGAKAEIYRLLRRLAAEGMATLLISSDMPELLSLSDRVLVLRKGTIAGELTREQATEEQILRLAIGAE